jgi:hypothetical protein
MLRGLVLILAVLAGLKIWTQERLYRQGAEDALILAYRERAIAACQSQAPDSSAPVEALPLWTQPASVAVAIGRSGVPVNVWEVGSALWSARFKHPHVVLTAAEQQSRAKCEYDVIEGRAYLSML